MSSWLAQVTAKHTLWVGKRQHNMPAPGMTTYTGSRGVQVRNKTTASEAKIVPGQRLLPLGEATKKMLA